MSLVGSLEDLGLGDILQIVSLSRKSGVLNLTWEDRKGKIIFRDGQVVAAVSNELPASTQSLLVEGASQIVSSQQIAQAMALKRGIGKEKSLKEILIERLGISAEKIEERIRDHVEKVVFHFFSWPEGNFNFELKEGAFENEELGPEADGLLLQHGLNPQFLAMEGTRLQDEKRRMQSAIPSSPPPSPSPASPPAHPEEHPGLHEAFRETATHPTPQTQEKAEISIKEELEPPQVLVVDDDPEILNLIIDKLRGLGLKGEGLLKVSEAFRRLEELVESEHCPVIIADLFMPRTDGEGILGGLELVRHTKTKYPFVPVVLVSDYPNESAQKEAISLGLDHYLDKPKRSQIWGDKPTPELARFQENLRNIIPEMVSKAVIPKKEKIIVPTAKVITPAEKLFDLGEEIRQELGEPSGTTSVSEDAVTPSRGLNLLKTMINELNDPSFSGQITLMVLRFAAEIMNRAIIFLVAKDQVAGLGQFGVELNGIDPVKQVRRMRIPISEPSIFREIIQKRTVYKKPLADTQWNNYLIRHLGGIRPVESFGAPIIAGGKIAAILYGDNVPELKPIGETDSLEIFLAQAGLAMERAFLERRISELSLRNR